MIKSIPSLPPMFSLDIPQYVLCLGSDEDGSEGGQTEEANCSIVPSGSSVLVRTGIVGPITLRHLGFLFTALFLLTFLQSCQTVDEKVARLVGESRFEEAREELEEENLWPGVPVEVDAEALSARDVFSDGVETYHQNKSQEFVAKGMLRSGLSVAEDGLALCPWSKDLGELTTDLRGRASELDRVESEWEGWSPSSGGHSIQSSRAFLDDLRPVIGDVADSPEILRLRGTVYEHLLAFWVAELQSRDHRISESEQAQLVLDLSLGEGALQTVELLAETLASYRGVFLFGIDEVSLDQVHEVSLNLDRLLSSSLDGGVKPIAVDLRSSVERWIESNIESLVVGSSPTYRDLGRAEALIEMWPTSKPMRQAAALAYLLRSSMVCVGGPSSLLARAYELRARELGGSSALSIEADVASKVASALSTTKWPNVAVSIDVNPGVEPWIGDLAILGVSSMLFSKRGWSSWELSKGRPDLEISIEKARAIETGFDQLDRVGSSYFSHFEDAPNPRKAVLKSRLSLRESYVESALNSYNSAVSAHNWNPTEWSLMNVNSAYSKYVAELDSYNDTVQQYNSCPDLVTRPVYLPYSFREGTFEFGWEFRFRVLADGFEETRDVDSISRDFVRVGTKYSDRSEERRKDDPLEIDTSADAAVGHLMDVLNGLEEVVGSAVASVRHELLAPLHDDEVQLLHELLHPWGPGASGELDSGKHPWIANLLVELSEEVPVTSPQIHFLSDPPSMPPRNASLEGLANWYAPISVQVLSKFATGSGVIVDGGGLILTCSHVLMSPEPIVVISEGPAQGEYLADILFANQESDVALIRARGLSTPRWAPVRLNSPPVRGEDVMAFGNPSLRAGGIGIGSSTKGSISNARAMRFGRPVVLADITIASGSSGGPLIGMSDGKIIGVVQAVMTEGIDAGASFASSGFICSGFPSDLLGDALGLSSK